MILEVNGVRPEPDWALTGVDVSLFGSRWSDTDVRLEMTSGFGRGVDLADTGVSTCRGVTSPRDLAVPDEISLALLLLP